MEKLNQRIKDKLVAVHKENDEAITLEEKRFDPITGQETEPARTTYGRATLENMLADAEDKVAGLKLLLSKLPKPKGGKK